MSAVATDLFSRPEREKDAKNASAYLDKIYSASSDASAQLGELQETRERENEKLNRPIEEKKTAEMQSDTDKTLQGMFGKSIEEMSNMSEDELETSISAFTKNMTGMNMEQLMALGDKSDEEIMAEMQKSGTLNRMAANKDVLDQQVQYGQKGMQIAGQTQRMMALSAEVMQISQNIEAERDRLEQESDKLREKHKALLNQPQHSKIVTLVQNYSRFGGGLISPQELAQMQAIEKELIPLLDAYYAKTLSEWRAHILAQIETAKKQEADLKRIEALNIEMLEVQGYSNTPTVPVGLESEWETVLECLSIARKFDEFFRPTNYEL
jgi:hypothetical protein